MNRQPQAHELFWSSKGVRLHCKLKFAHPTSWTSAANSNFCDWVQQVPGTASIDVRLRPNLKDACLLDRPKWRINNVGTAKHAEIANQEIRLDGVA